MAGQGRRFSDAGYKLPKPLIDVNGKPMIQRVIENLGMEGNYIFIVQNEHYEKFGLEKILCSIVPECTIIIIDGMTDGACVTALEARDLIDTTEDLVIANSDQLADFNPSQFLDECQGYDAGILTVKRNEEKYSYARIEDGMIVEVAEKKVISDDATVGIYYFKRGSDFVRYADSMIAKNIRTNNEFYICPVFNEFISDGKQIRAVRAKGMDCLGTPEDLKNYLESK
jgi:NDP-sugar pyrophosphorylase family protein